MEKLQRRTTTIVDLVKVSFHRTHRLYTFKTFLKLKVGDHVVIRTQNGLTLGFVHSMNASFNPAIKYNWIMEKFNENKIESKFRKKLKQLNIKE